MRENQFFNEIYDDRVHKCTFDIPLYLWARLQDKVKKGTLYNNNKSAYIRALLERDLVVGDRMPTKAEYSRMMNIGVQYPVDPPNKFMGFIGGLKRNSYVYSWFTRKSQKSIDKVSTL